jgi:hypothetical protein
MQFCLKKVLVEKSIFVGVTTIPFFLVQCTVTLRDGWTDIANPICLHVVHIVERAHLKIQSVPQRKHNASPLQRSVGECRFRK